MPCRNVLDLFPFHFNPQNSVFLFHLRSLVELCKFLKGSFSLMKIYVK